MGKQFVEENWREEFDETLTAQGNGADVVAFVGPCQEEEHQVGKGSEHAKERSNKEHRVRDPLDKPAVVSCNEASEDARC